MDARDALQKAAGKGLLETRPALPVGTLCTVVLTCAGHERELFGRVAAQGYQFTDELADLRFEIRQFLDAIGEKPTAGGDENKKHSSSHEPVITKPSTPEAAAVDFAGAIDEWDPGISDSVQPVAGEPGAGAIADGEKHGEDLDDDDVLELQKELGTQDPLLTELRSIQKLSLPQKVKLAEEGDLSQRTLLYRMYGPVVFEGLLKNPRLTEMEVAKLAKLGNISTALIQVIGRKVEWLRAERVRNALLSNPRTPPAIVHKVLSLLGKHELKALLQRRDFPPQNQAAVRDMNLKLLKGS